MRRRHHSKRRSRRAKARTQRVHAKRRAAERLGITLTDDDLDRIVDVIQSGGAELIARQSNRVTLWRLELEGHKVVVAYDRIRKQPATFIPGDWITE